MVEKWKYDEICIKPPPTTLLNWIPQGPQPHPYALLRRFYVKTDLSERGVTFGHHWKNGSWTGPRRLWTPKPASWSRGRIQVDAKERHHQAPPCIKVEEIKEESTCTWKLKEDSKRSNKSCAFKGPTKVAYTSSTALPFELKPQHQETPECLGILAIHC